VTLGVADRQGVLGDPVDDFCGERLDGTVYGLLHRERDRLFGDELFADLFTTRGRRSIPPSVVACVLVLKQLEGLSDVEAIDRFTYDVRWRYACGVGGWDGRLDGFDRTVLVRFRMRLEASDDPRRIFTATTTVAAEAGLVGVRRVLDSAPLFDAVATMDTVTLIRSAIRGLLKAADATLESQLRGLLSGADDYRAAGKPACDWDDPDARAELIDRLACDGMALLAALEGRLLPGPVTDAAGLVATVIGQDLEADESGTFRIVRGVAADRVISTVDPDARHGRKSTSGKFDGYKGHVAIDPDSEIITDAAAGPANAGDGQMTGRLTADLDHTTGHDSDNSNTDTDGTDATGTDDTDGDDATGTDGIDTDGDTDDEVVRPAVYGDAAYGSGDQLAELDARGIDAKVKCQPPSSRNGRFSKDDFTVDLDAQTVSCPAGATVPIVRAADGSGVAHFAAHCAACPLRSRCTDAARGRNVTIHRHEALLARQRQRGRDPDWLADYRATRPKVERKLAHLIRRGRRARRRGLERVDADWALLAGAVNLARLATLRLNHTPGGWQIAPA
jgi:transposase